VFEFAVTHRGVVLLVGLLGFSFAAGFLLGLVPMNSWVRASLISLGVTALLVAPQAAEPQYDDIEAGFWVVIALWAAAALIVAFGAGVLARFAFRRRSTTPRSST
jgi:hypothetical protein